MLITLLWLGHLIAANTARAAEPVQLRNSYAGYIDFELLGNSLLTGNDCNTSTASRSSTDSTSVLPNPSAVVAAWLYWAGSYNPSGNVSTPDFQVTLNTPAGSSSVSADRLYTDNFTGDSTEAYFSGIAEVTNQVKAAGNGTYGVTGLTVFTGSPHCGYSTIVAGWALVIIYEKSGQALHVLNIFDGFQYYYGNAISLTPNNFVIPSIPSGKHAHITWEGDEANSGSRNGYNESLQFQGNNLTDAGNPGNNQFNSYSNVRGSTTGVDIDEYDISAYLTPGATSATTTYSSGSDMVFLSAEIISVSNAPVADLSISSTSASSVNSQTNYPLILNISNNGPIASGNFSTDISLPSGMTYTGYSGTNWSCSPLSAGSYRCNYSGSIAKNASAPALTINTYVPYSAANSLTITASVTGSSFDNIQANNSLNKVITLNKATFETSLKSVEDLNGGTVNPGDTLRYTLSIQESAGIALNNFSVTDNLPANISRYSFVSLPAGSSNQSTPTGGTNGTGFIDLRNLSIAANGTVNIVYDAVVSSSAANGAAISNSFNILVGAVTAQTINATTLYIAGNSNGMSYNKPLYLNSGGSLSRSAPSADSVVILSENGSTTFTLNPALQKNMTITNVYGAIPINIWMSRSNSTNNNRSYSISLGYGINSATTSIGSLAITNEAQNTIATLKNLSITLNNSITIPAGNKIFLTITNTSSGSGQRNLDIHTLGSSPSFVGLQATTVIAVDNLTLTDTVNNTVTSLYTSETLKITSTVSDPFGEADISNVLLEIYDANGALVTTLNAATLSLADSDASAATKTLAFNYTPVASLSNAGMWKFRIVANEGNEGWVSAYASKLLEIKFPVPDVILTKTPLVISDPVNGTNNPKAIPGAVVQYSILALNQGKGATDNNSVVIADAIPANTSLIVSNFDTTTNGPIKFVDGTAPNNSGLNYSFSALNSSTDTLEFSIDGTDYSYSPVAEVNGTDSNIRFFRIRPSGAMGAASVTAQPQFEFKYKVTLH